MRLVTFGKVIFVRHGGVFFFPGFHVLYFYAYRDRVSGY